MSPGTDSLRRGVFTPQLLWIGCRHRFGDDLAENRLDDEY